MRLFPLYPDSERPFAVRQDISAETQNRLLAEAEKITLDMQDEEVVIDCNDATTFHELFSMMLRARRVCIVCERTALSEHALEKPRTYWNANLFRRIDDIDFTSKTNPSDSTNRHLATRLLGLFEIFSITHVVDLLLIQKSLQTNSSHILRDRPTGERRIKEEWRRNRRPIEDAIYLQGYGNKCHRRVLEVLDWLGIHPDTDLTDFEWEKVDP